MRRIRETLAASLGSGRISSSYRERRAAVGVTVLMSLERVEDWPEEAEAGGSRTGRRDRREVCM